MLAHHLGVGSNISPQGISYYTPITIADQTFNLIMDTGSSDTWVAQTGFQCYNITTKDPLPEAACKFGRTYAPGSEFDVIENTNFNTFYGDGSFADGMFGLVNVTLGGIRFVSLVDELGAHAYFSSLKAQIAVAKDAGWIGDGITSGFLGLAYPDLVQEFSGTNLTNDTYINQGLSPHSYRS